MRALMHRGGRGFVDAARWGLVAIGTIVVVAGSAVAQTKVEEKIVGRSAPRSNAYIVSTNGVHYAVLTPKGAQSSVVIDGAEGPAFDELLDPRGKPGQVAYGVVFSADGSRHAYFVRTGREYILVADGKELYRGELVPSNSNIGYSDMRFSPGGKHVYFVDLKSEGGRAKAQLIMDGKPGPASGHQAMLPVFSLDESRWAYNAVKLGGRIG